MNITRQFFVPPVHNSLFSQRQIFQDAPIFARPSTSSHFNRLSVSPFVIPSHSASSVNGTPRNRHVDLPSPTSAGIPYSCEHYSSVFLFRLFTIYSFSVSNLSGRLHLLPSFHLIPFQAICRFPHPSFHPILLRLRTSSSEADLWTFLLQLLKPFRRMRPFRKIRQNPTETKRCNFHPKALSTASTRGYQPHVHFVPRKSQWILSLWRAWIIFGDKLVTAPT